MSALALEPPPQWKGAKTTSGRMASVTSAWKRARPRRVVSSTTSSCADAEPRGRGRGAARRAGVGRDQLQAAGAAGLRAGTQLAIQTKSAERLPLRHCRERRPIGVRAGARSSLRTVAHQARAYSTVLDGELLNVAELHVQAEREVAAVAVGLRYRERLAGVGLSLRR